MNGLINNAPGHPLSRTVFALLLGLGLSGPVRASIVYTSISQDTAMVGDRIGLTVSLVVPPGARIIPPETEDGFGRFTVKEWSHDRHERSSSDSLAFNYVLSLYIAEQCTIPSLQFEHVINDSTQDTLVSDAIPIRLVSVVTSDSADIRDLKAQQNAGKPSLGWLWALLLIAYISAGVWFGRWAYLKGKKPPAPPPPKPAYEEALGALEALEARQFLMKGMVREYVFELSDILKHYIERRFETNASEYTTEEMLEWIESGPLDTEGRGALRWFFSETDPVKFARHVPGPDTIQRFDVEVRSFLERTRPAPRPPETAKKEDRGI